MDSVKKNTNLEYKPSNPRVMQFTLNAGGQVLILKKLPRQNVIQAKISGKTILYERRDKEIIKQSDEIDPNEPRIIQLITQYFVSDGKHNRHRYK